MKWLFIALLLMNIGYFAWEYNHGLQHAQQQSTTPPPIPATVERLVLTRELPKPLPARGGPGHNNTVAKPEANISAVGSQSAADVKAVVNSKPETSPIAAKVEEAKIPVTGNADAKPAESMPTPPVTAPVKPPSAPSCLAIGPFPSEVLANRAQRWFTEHGAEAKPRKEEQTEIKMYWVYMELKTPEAVKPMVNELRQKGISDVIEVHKGEVKNAVSLGVYSSELSANTRAAELNQKGYQAKVGPRIKNIRVNHWLDIRGVEVNNLLEQAKNKILQGTPASACN